MKKKQKQNRIRVMVVDDHAGLRKALHSIIKLRPDLEVVAEANNGERALELFPVIKPDVVLMDGSMPGMNGIEATLQLRKLQPDARIIALTLYEQSMYLEEMAAAGARGFIVKTGDPEQLFEAIRTVAAGGTYFDSSVTRLSPPGAPPASTPKKLTSNESAVAKLLANGRTNGEIANSLGIAIEAVEKYRTAAMKKLGVHNRAGLVRIAAERHWLAT
jgi:DNA-binding NarL/FixJ family response regulator